MFINYKTWNNITSNLTNAISSQTTVIAVNDWSIFPNTFPYLLTVEERQEGVVITREIMKATAKSWNNITVTRAVESCISNDSESPKVLQQAPHNFKTNSSVTIAMTAWTLKDVQDEIISQDWRISTAENDIIDLNNYIDTLEYDIQNL